MSNPDKILIGQPVDDDVDVGLAVREGREVTVDIWSGSSVLSPGESMGTAAVIDKVLSPLTQLEAGTVRCIGLNVSAHRIMAADDSDVDPEGDYQLQSTDFPQFNSTGNMLLKQAWRSPRFPSCS